MSLQIPFQQPGGDAEHPVEFWLVSYVVVPCTLGEPEACLLGRTPHLKADFQCLPESAGSLPAIRVYMTPGAVRNGRHKTFLYKLRGSQQNSHMNACYTTFPSNCKKYIP